MTLFSLAFAEDFRDFHFALSQYFSVQAMAGLAHKMVLNAIHRIVESLRASYSSENKVFPFSSDEDAIEALQELFEASSSVDLASSSNDDFAFFIGPVVNELRESFSRALAQERSLEEAPPVKRFRSGAYSSQSSLGRSLATGPPISRSVSRGGASMASSSCSHIQEEQDDDIEEEEPTAGPSSSSKGKGTAKKHKRSGKKWYVFVLSYFLHVLTRTLHLDFDRPRATVLDLPKYFSTLF